MKYFIILIFFITTASFGIETLPIKPFGISFQEEFKKYGNNFQETYASSILANIYEREFSPLSSLDPVELKHRIVIRFQNLNEIAKVSRFFKDAKILGIVSQSRIHNVGIIAKTDLINRQDYDALLLILKNKYGKPNFGKTGWLVKDSISGEEICINLTENKYYTIISYIIKNDYLLEQLILETQKAKNAILLKEQDLF